MAFETRGNQQYYYRKKRIGDTVVSEYIGSGEIGYICHTLDLIERGKRQLELAQQRAQIEQDRQLDNVIKQIRQVVNTVLRVTGHYQHKGQWRKKRKMTKQTALEKSLEKIDIEHVFRLVRVTEEGMTDNEKNKLILRRDMSVLRDELGYNEVSTLEKMLIDCVSMSWLRLWLIESVYSGKLASGMSGNETEFYERLISAAQRRHLRAITALTRVRKLASNAPEILQINIAQNQQVNN